jgi:hypothetical protein
MFRRVLLIFVVLVGGGFVAGDQMTRVYAEHQIERRADQYYPHENGSSASISGWPFTVRLLTAGEVKRIEVNLYGFAEQQLFIRRLTLTLDEVKLDRNSLFRRKIRLRDLGAGEVAVDIDGSSVAKLVGRDVRFRKGSVEVHDRIAGREVVATGSLSIDAGALVFEPSSVSSGGLTVPARQLAFRHALPKSDLWPCSATVESIEGGVFVTCTVHNIPSRLTGLDLSTSPN